MIGFFLTCLELQLVMVVLVVICGPGEFDTAHKPAVHLLQPLFMVAVSDLASK